MDKLLDELTKFRRQIKKSKDWLEKHYPEVASELRDYLDGKKKAQKSSNSQNSAIMPVEDVNPTKQAISHYCDEWKLKYGTHPMIDRASAMAMKRTVTDFGLERTKVLITAYLQMGDQWFLTRSHDLRTFSGNLSKIKVYAEKGLTLTREDTRRIEKKDANKRKVSGYFGED